MEHIDNACDSLRHYFDALEAMGYYDKTETKNLLVYLFIVDEVFEGDLGVHLDDEGLASFEKALECLYKGCLINPVMESNMGVKAENLHGDEFRLRYTEDSYSRSTEEKEPRITEDDY